MYNCKRSASCSRTFVYRESSELHKTYVLAAFIVGVPSRLRQSHHRYIGLAPPLFWFYDAA